VLPTKCPLPEFYKELWNASGVLARKKSGWAALRQCAELSSGNCFGQTISSGCCGSQTACIVLSSSSPITVAGKIDISLAPPSVATGATQEALHSRKSRTQRPAD